MTYSVTDKYGQVFSHVPTVGRDRGINFAIIATYPHIPEHVFAGQVVRGSAGGRRAMFSSMPLGKAKKMAEHQIKHFRASDVEIITAIDKTSVSSDA